jgi:hypothetical protein
MNTCPYCGAELPGMERVCRDCWEKRCAAQSSRYDWKRFVLNFFIFAGLLAAGLLAIEELPSLMPPWALVRLSAFSANVDALGSATILSINLVLTGIVVIIGFWDSLRALRAGTWRIPLLWMIYVPSLVGLLFWKVIGDASFRATALSGALLIAAFRFVRRFMEWYSS